MADFDVAVVLRLVDRLSAPAQAAANRLRQVQRNLQNVGNSMMAAGTRMTTVMTGPLVAGMAGMTKTAVDFDTAMGDLAKVFQGTPEQLAATRNQIMEFSKTLPLAQSELAKLFTAANQANIPLAEQAKFVQLASEFMVAFDTSADRAADALARLQASQGLTVQGLRDLAGTMNIIANNSAATEPEMLNLANRIAALGRVAGGPQAVNPLLALGGAAVSMGVDVERASTGLRNMLLNLAAGTSAPRRVQEALESLGLSAEETQRRLTQDTGGTLVDVLERLDKLPQELRLAKLNDLFGRRAVDALGPLLSNLPEAIRLLRLTQDEQRRSASVGDEFARRMERAAPKFQLFMNSLRGLSISIAEHWLEPITKAVTKLTEWVNALSPSQQKIAAWAIGIGAVLGPVVGVLGLMVSGIAKLLGPLARLGAVMGRAGLAGSIGLLATAARGLLRFLGPAGLLALGAHAVFTNWEKIAPAFDRARESVIRLAGKFQPLWDALDRISTKVAGIKISEIFKNFNLEDAIVQGSVTILTNFSKTVDTLSSSFTAIKTAAETVINYLKTHSLAEAFNDFLKNRKSISDQLQDWGRSIWQGLTPSVPTIPAPPGLIDPSRPMLPGPGMPSGPIKRMSMSGIGNRAASLEAPGARELRRRLDQFRDPPEAAGARDLRRQLSEFVGGDRPARLAAAAPVQGRLPAGLTVEAKGPEIRITQAPPAINVTVNASTNADPEAIANAVARVVDRQTRAGMYDGVHEA